MVDYNKFAYARVNRWVQNDLDKHGLMPKRITVNNLPYPTLMPSGQQPEVNDSVDPKIRQTPYIVYGIEEDNANTDQWRRNEGLTYAVFGPTYESVMAILQCLQDLCGREDWSVDDLNDEEPNSAFHFMTLTFDEVSGSDPVGQEGGRYAGMVGLRYSYLYNEINGVPGTKGVGRKLN